MTKLYCMLLVVLIACVAAAQPGTLKNGMFEGRPAIVMSNDKLELTITMEGSTLANLILADDPEKLSPLWSPIRMARELGAATLPTTVGGHFVCVDGFGPTSPEERAAGLPNHGEAHVVMFEERSRQAGSTNVVTLAARLPIVQELFTRTFRLVDGENVIYVESQLENLLGFDRPVNWAEHATIGSPFLASGETVVDLAGTRAQTRPWQQPANNQLQRRLASGKDFTWPLAPALDGTTINLRETPKDPHYIDHSAILLDPSRQLAWVSAMNLKKRLIIGYLFKREEYPWLQMWWSFPATGKLARGLEFGTQPYDVPRRDAVSTGAMFGMPTYRWLPAKSRIETHFLLFYARLPEGFQKVDEVRLENGQLVIEDRAAQKRVMLVASLGL